MLLALLAPICYGNRNIPDVLGQFLNEAWHDTSEEVRTGNRGPKKAVYVGFLQLALGRLKNRLPFRQHKVGQGRQDQGHCVLMGLK